MIYSQQFFVTNLGVTMARKETASQRKCPEMGERIKCAREAKKLTQQQMADYFGITKQGWQNYEYGREMKSGMIVQVCAILECSPSWLLGIKDEGMHLPPESELLKALKAEFEKLNDKGQKKAVENTHDLTFVPEYSKSEADEVDAGGRKRKSA